MASVFNNVHGVIEVVLGDVLEFVFEVTDGSEQDPVTVDDVLDRYQIYNITGSTVAPLPSVSSGTWPRDMAALVFSSQAPGGTIDRLYGPDATAVGDGATNLYVFNSTDWTYGDSGMIVAWDASNASGASSSYIQQFRVTRGAGIEKLTDVQTADNDTPMLAAPNTILGRLWTVEKNQRDVLMPRQRRILGLLGEHQVVDAFLYDDDGNITECRLRFFDTKAHSAEAAKWTDRLNQVDPRVTPGGDAGEVGLYTITADNLLPRNLRTLFEQKIDADPADNLFGTGLGDGTTGSTV